MKVQVHQVVAYQKYGDEIFEPGVMCRHMDNDKTNFSAQNISLGTARDNYLDNSPRVTGKLMEIMKREGRKRRKLSIQEADEIRGLVKNGETYQTLSIRFGLSKSAISYLVNYRTYKGI